MSFNPSYLTVYFMHQVMARRVEPDGRMKVLVHWYPEDMWVQTQAVVTSDIHILQVKGWLICSLLAVCQTNGWQRQKPRVGAMCQYQAFLLLPWQLSKLSCLCLGGTSSDGNPWSPRDDRTLFSRFMSQENWGKRRTVWNNHVQEVGGETGKKTKTNVGG
jgi:hypothetical protein